MIADRFPKAKDSVELLSLLCLLSLHYQSRSNAAPFVEGILGGCYNRCCSARPDVVCELIPNRSGFDRQELRLRAQVEPQDGQVAQVVERSPEKAGVGGSTPSLATMFSTT